MSESPAGEDASRKASLKGKYANYFRVGHNALEVLIDFGQVYAEGGREHFHTRIITSPPYAKEFLKVLLEAVEQYEKAFGAIRPQE